MTPAKQKLRLAVGVFLTNGMRVVEVCRVLPEKTVGGEGGVLVLDVRNDLETPDFESLSFVDLDYWRNVDFEAEFIPEEWRLTDG